MEDIRIAVAAARRMLYREGCDSAVGGHVSVRAAGGEDAFWVTPLEYFDETVPERVCKVAFADLALRVGDAPISPAVEFHARIYEARPEVASIVHTHAHHVSVFATAERPIPPCAVGGATFAPRQAFYGDDGGQPIEARRGADMVAAIRDHDVLLFKNHGVVVLGRSLADATVTALLVEHAARHHLSGGGPSEPGPLDVPLDRVVPQIWDANIRRLRRSDPEVFAA